MRFIIPILITSLFTLPAHAAEKEFRTWWAACDNLRNCSAYGFADAGDTNSYMRIERSGAAQAKPIISIGIRNRKLKDLKFQLAFDDSTLPGLSQQISNSEPKKINRVVINSNNNDAFLESLRKAKSIIITSTPIDTDNAPYSTISLDGAVAALLWIDDQQQRVGTTTAMMKRGDKAVSLIPAQPKAPKITAAPPLQGAASKIQPPKSDLATTEKKAVLMCGADDNGKLQSISALSTNDFLYEVSCPLASGAYNLGYMYSVASAGQPENIHLATFISPPNQKINDTHGMRFNGSFDNTTMKLNAIYYGRGVGDCGEQQTWLWNGKSFNLSEIKRMPSCLSVPIEEWPNVYTTDIH